MGGQKGRGGEGGRILLSLSWAVAANVRESEAEVRRRRR